MISRKPPGTTSSIGEGRGRSGLFRGVALCGLLFASLALSGCAGKDAYLVDVAPEVMRAYLADKPEPLHPYYRKVLREGKRNLVLNHMEAGLAAMELGKYPLAERSFDQALLNIETVYVNDENAVKARSLWYEEGRKDFKGEPYERAMAYYYRGLLYLRRGDFENARACFKVGQLQDAFAEEEQYRADFALLMFLEGWASQRLGDEDLAREAYQEVRKYRPDFVAPDPRDNVLLIAETGTAPVKVAGGPGGSELRFQEGFGFREERARFWVPGMEIYAYPMEDIYWQASTRGGRPVDKILQGKVHFRQTHETMGRALTETSLHALALAPAFGKDSGKVAIAAGIVGLVGLTQQAMAASTRTEADARSWDNLPDKVHLATVRMTPANQEFDVSFLDGAGRTIGGLERSGPIHFTEGGTGWGWVRSRSALLYGQAGHF